MDKEYQRKYREKHVEERREYKRIYRKEHPKKIKEYWEKHRERINEMHRKSYLRRKKKEMNTGVQYIQKNENFPFYENENNGNVFIKIDGKEYLEKTGNGSYMLLLGKYPLYIGHAPMKIIITPEDAEKILEKYNQSNRSLSLERIKKLANSMAENKFELNGDTIKFCDGNLVDGQHRLKACILAKKELPALVCLIKESAVKTIDTYSARSGQNILELKGHNVNDARYLARAISVHASFMTEDSLVRTNISKSDSVSSTSVSKFRFFNFFSQSSPIPIGCLKYCLIGVNILCNSFPQQIQ